MAIKDIDEHKRLKIEDAWEGRSGEQVEDAITRNVISGINYDKASEILSLTRLDGSVLETKVSAVNPSYIYGIIIYGVRIDGGKAHNAEKLLMQYREGKKVEVGIAIKSVADRTGTQTTVNKPFDVTIKFNNSTKIATIYPIDHKYFKTEGTGIVLDIPEGEKADDIVIWVDITEFFKKSCSNKKIEASFKQVDLEDKTTKTYSNTLQTFITNEVINLVYKGDTVITNNKVDILFDPSSTVSSNYKISGFINGNRFENQKGNLTISDLQPGLNQICVRAIHGDNPEVYTDWLVFDIIYAESNYTDTVVAVNGVSSYITNNGVATLYDLNIYSPKNEEVEIITYLNDDEPSPPLNDQSQLKELKREIINPSSYDVNTNIAKSTYQKYIEVFSDNSIKYLLIKIDGKFYSFQEPSVYEGANYLDLYYFKEMMIEAINSNYTYTNNYSTSLNFDQIVGQTNNVFVTKTYSDTPTVNELLESSDGWHDNNGRTYFKVSAQPIDIFKNGGLRPQLGNNFTIELGIKTYNVSNIDSNILTIGKLQLRPTSVSWLLNRDNYTDYSKYQEDLLKRISKFQEDVETHIVITLNSNWCISDYPNFYYPDYLGEEQAVFEKGVESTRGNLIRIYINGVIDREYIITDTDVEDLKKAVIQLRTENSDIDFYLFRIYNNAALDFSEVIKNYISFLPEKTGKGSKEEFYNKNDILNDQGMISWERCQGHLNTLLYVFPEGGLFPHRFWGGEDGDTNNPNKKARVSLFINYADPKDNVQYGGRLNNLQVKGQGSSAMRYLIWNVGSQVKKHEDADGNAINSIFTPQGLLNPESIPEDYTAVESLKELKNCYYMPAYSDQADPEAPTYAYKKMVGKVNYASSMQSHKIGACKLYADAYYKSLGALRSGGLKAVHEEPFMYFYLETKLSNDQVEKLTWEEVMSMSDQIKFMGFQTWGPGKGDKACSGYDEDLTPEYLMLEGGENGDESVNFLVPWHDLQRGNKDIGSDTFVYRNQGDLRLSEPQVTQLVSENHPEYNLWIDDESIVYKVNDKGSPIGAWDIDFGCEEVEKNVEAGILKGYFKFDDKVLNSLKKFRTFYDFVYISDFTFIVEPSTVKFASDSWDKTRKHVVTSGQFKYNESDIDNVQGHQQYDVYRYDIVNKRWVKAGLFFNNGDWDRLNYMNSFYGNELTKLPRFNEFQVRNELKTLFTNHIGDYIDIQDTAFHQAFIKYLSGTDNRAKNTYFQIIGPVYKWIDEEAGTKELNEALSDYKIRFIGDDLDTILATDNNGLQSKDYNLIEDSYNLSYNSTWGDKGNIFFRMFDLTYEADIKKRLGDVMTTASMSASGVNETSSYFYRTFFKVQEDFPAIAYNHTAKIYYENAYAILHAPDNKGAYGSFSYTHNDVDPIGQSHGSCLECERQFMKERIGFLAGYALSNLDSILDVSGGSGGGGSEMKLLLEFEPFQDFYPSYNAGDNTTTFKSIGDLRTVTDQPVTYEELQTTAQTNRLVAKQGESYTARITDSGIHQQLLQVGMFKSLSITGLTLTSLTGNFDKSVNFEIDNAKVEDNIDFFGEEWPGMAITDTITNMILPVVQTLNLKQMILPDTLDLSTYYKLQKLDVTGSSTKYIIFPQTGHFTSVAMPATINQFRIYNNPGLTSESITFEGYDNIETVYIDCAKCGQFDVSQFCENIKKSPLKSVTIRNANFNITEEALNHIIAPGVDYNIQGTITIVESLESTTPKNISFMTKYQLVNSFGNIDSGQHGLVVKYATSRITEMFEYPRQVNAYYNSKDGGTQPFEGYFNINIPEGNNVKIKEGTNPFNSKVNSYLDISYKLQSQITGVSINSISGTLTLTQLPATNAKVVITVNTTDDSFSNSSDPTEVSFKWVAPSIGDFAYADGSFSRSVNPQKTMIGLVYAKSSDSDNRTGTVYIVGKEYANDAHYSWYTTNGANSAVSGVPNNIHELNTYVNKNFNLSSTIPDFDDSQIGDSFINDITVENGNEVMLLSMTGKSDTNAYVKYVNNYMLSKIYALITKTGIGSSGGNYFIKNKEDLNNLCLALERSQIISGAGSVESSLVFPYFYSAYVYEPTLMFANETLNDQYKGGKWFAPSYGELARIIYYRGYSARGSQFSSASNVADDINVNMQDLGTALGTPIFSIAAKALNQNFPDCWKNIINTNTNTSDIIGSQNIVTTAYTTATPDSYTYQAMQSSTDYTTSTREIHYEWIRGGNVIDQWYNNGEEQDIRAWAYKKHQGLPFTEFNYVNPQEE